VVAWIGGVCGGAATLAAVFATFTGRGWRIAVFVLAVVAVFALLVLHRSRVPAGIVVA